MRTVIFDLDGTLADTSRDLIDAANAWFEHLGAGPQLDHGTDAETAFRGGRAMLRLGYRRLGRVADEAAVDAGYGHLLEAYARHIDRHTRLYPGAAEAVAALRRAGVAVGVCTNKPEGLARLLLDRLGVGDGFGPVIGADTLPVRKPDPAPLYAAIDAAGGDRARAMLVGDTDTDRETARAAGCLSVLVTFGPAGRRVAALAPDALLEGYGALPGLVADLLGPA